jgi:hypothetical protein
LETEGSMLHAGMFSSQNGPGYRDTGYGVGAGLVNLYIRAVLFRQPALWFNLN